MEYGFCWGRRVRRDVEGQPDSGVREQEGRNDVLGGV